MTDLATSPPAATHSTESLSVFKNMLQRFRARRIVAAALSVARGPTATVQAAQSRAAATEAAPDRGSHQNTN
jgi:hypothetical protein